MKIKTKMIHNLKKMCQRQHPKSKNKKTKMFHHKHKSPTIHPNKHPRKHLRGWWATPGDKQLRLSSLTP